MWAIVRDADSAKNIAALLNDQITFKNQGDFKIDAPRSLRSLTFDSKPLTGMTISIQRTGLGSLQDIHACTIPPLVYAKQLSVEPLVDFVRQQVKDHEERGHWAQIVPVYIELFQTCKPLGIEHAALRKTTAILIGLFLTISTELKLREPEAWLFRGGDGVSLDRWRQLLIEELNPREQKLEPYPLSQDGSIRNLIWSFAELYREQQRLDLGLWSSLLSRPTGHPRYALNLDYGLVPTAGGAKAREALGWSSLHSAVLQKLEHNDPVRVTELLKAHADPNAIDLAGWTPLHYAIEIQNQKDAKILIETLADHGADIHMRGRDGTGLLHCAAKKGYADVILQLLGMDAKTEVRDSSGKTPLHWAARSGCGAAVENLLNNGAFIGARDDDERTALHLAVNKETVTALTSRGIQADVKDRHGRRALHTAACRGDETVVRTLMELYTREGLEREGDFLGQTALHCAAACGHEAIVRMLIDEYKFDKDAKRFDKATVLHSAAFWGHEAVVRLLIELGADRGATDRARETARKYASRTLNHFFEVMSEREPEAGWASIRFNGRTALGLESAELDPKVIGDLQSREFNLRLQGVHAVISALDAQEGDAAAASRRTCEPGIW